jgi:hypothetical protein
MAVTAYYSGLYWEVRLRQLLEILDELSLIALKYLRATGLPGNENCKLRHLLSVRALRGSEVHFATCSDHRNHRTGRFLSC